MHKNAHKSRSKRTLTSLSSLPDVHPKESDADKK